MRATESRTPSTVPTTAEEEAKLAESRTYWEGYAAGFKDGKLIVLDTIVDTFNPDNGMNGHRLALKNRIKELR